MRKLKTILQVIFISLGLFLVLGQVSSAEIIRSYDSNIVLNTDSSFNVEERIFYDFEEENKHGIFRIIPLKNSNNNLIKIDGISVIDEKNIPFKFTTNISNDELNIRIGDKNELISGIKEYIIKYRVLGGITYYDDFDELYWNITGNDWQVPIEKVSSTIEVPKIVEMSKTQSGCYIGLINSKEKCETRIEDNFIKTNIASPLKNKEGLTVAVGFPKNIVYKPANKKNTISLIKDIFILFIPLMVFIGMFLIWKKKGRDSKGLSTIIAEYEPLLNMKPTLTGSLVDGKVDYRDITAGLIYLAEQGFVRIKKIDKEWAFGKEDYEIELEKDDISSLEKTEKSIIDLFFSGVEVRKIIKISNLQKDVIFRTKAKALEDDIYQEMKDRGFYEKNPQKVKLPYIIIGGALIFWGAFSYIALSGIIILVFGLMMRKKTKMGAETKDHILGFKKFLSVTERERLDFHNAPEKKPEQFMKFLPYAIALGIEKKWAKQFESIYVPGPTWYSVNGAVTSFVAVDFATNISNLSGFISKSSGLSGGGSSGGGFSGGGGGGGGGGSW